MSESICNSSCSISLSTRIMQLLIMAHCPAHSGAARSLFWSSCKISGDGCSARTACGWKAMGNRKNRSSPRPLFFEIPVQLLANTPHWRRNPPMRTVSSSTRRKARIILLRGERKTKETFCSGLTGPFQLRCIRFQSQSGSPGPV